MYEKISLPNGARIVYEEIPWVHTAAVGFWVGVGSRDEKRGENGAAHFIEHALFKGTANHTAQELAARMDDIGGQTDAYTTRENTCLYARVRDCHLDAAVDVISEMLLEPCFREEDVQSEKGVIIEEIGMYEDSPEDTALDRLTEACFKGALGRPILGSRRTVSSFTADSLRDFKERHYTPDKLVVAVCGRFEEASIRRIADKLSTLPPAGRREKPKPSAYAPAVTVKKRPTEQNHLCLGFPGNAMGSEDRFALGLLSSVLGGGMSSRLFQTVRETHGLCYSIYSFGSAYRETGLFTVAVALGRETEDKALGLILEEIRRIREDGVTPAELQRAREQVMTALVIGAESTSSRMSRLGGGELFLGRRLSSEELLEKYDAVTHEDILSAARTHLDFSALSLSAVGRVCSADDYREKLARLVQDN